MAKQKQLAVSTQLKNALQSIADLQKKLDETTKSKDRHYQERQTVEAELEQVHAILDAIPAAPARRFKPEDAYSEIERKTPARLAAFFAVR
jgi:predicted nuclease with TOPRIM domain